MCISVCCECCGLRLREKDRVRVFIFQNNLLCVVARSHSPRSDSFLNDGVETGCIFEVFSQSAFLCRDDGNSLLGFKMADISCINTYFTNKHFMTHLSVMNNSFKMHILISKVSQINCSWREWLCYSKRIVGWVDGERVTLKYLDGPVKVCGEAREPQTNCRKWWICGDVCEYMWLKRKMEGFYLCFLFHAEAKLGAPLDIVMFNVWWHSS